MQVVNHGCTLDCWDLCKFKVYIDNGKVVKIEGDKGHPYTKGIICVKGKKHLERLYHKNRKYSPMFKKNGKWIEITFNEALELISKKLRNYKEKFGSSSILHYFESGSGGVLKSIENIFFNFLGGITLPKGSLCWGAGIQAQKYDFGDIKGHTLDDILNSKNIIIWGRNPANTSIHLMYMLKKAKKKGKRIIVIDPIYTDTAKIADTYIRINPSTDGALAMAITKIIIEEKLYNESFVRNYIKGFKEYNNYLKTLDLDYLSDETGVGIEIIRKLAYLYTQKGPSTTYIGYGLQRYKNGGNTVRAIDALASISGNIGIEGGGVNYANRVYPDILNLDPYNSLKYAHNTRYFNVSNFYNFIIKEDNPPIKAMFITKANPLTQMPNLNKVKLAFEKIDFKVCIDLFMTDTANECDLFIPCTNTLESEDIVFSSMNNPYIIYNEKAVEPKNKLMDEYYFFQELSKKMDIKEYPLVSKKEYLNKVIEPLKEINIDLEKIKEGKITIQTEKVAWKNLEFKTPSKKIEIYSEKAKGDGLSPLPVYNKQTNNKIRLITSHPRDSLFSQHFMDVKGITKAYLNSNLAKSYDLKDNEKVTLKSKNGEIKVQVIIKDNIPDNIIHMYIGWWHKHGAPNFLTNNISSDMGGQIAFNDTFVEIIKNNN
ncbi:molybdopterin-dependent oxidoreductase [Thermohalobacter berrensis]|uniref:Molybdopterin oxidoreductase n=1 Tax=Thermohalobacter berrensis TaxID=99594 RepID=A0A419TAY9_9FIRM|nr:molybdopterin-dependent oxidoreductase [Thermohalobacter berrensis]RKD34622.1 molybdopterin oxidoreductase [Thermohalobacter berrensis]